MANQSFLWNSYNSTGGSSSRTSRELAFIDTPRCKLLRQPPKTPPIFLGIEDEGGTLEAGKIADVLVISGNLLEDLNDLTDIHMVIHNGTIIRDEN